LEKKFLLWNISPPPVVGRDYRLNNFWLAKEVNKELKKGVPALVFIKTIKYYENTNCTLKKGKKKIRTIVTC
jgi:hypothetical protein